MVNCLISVSDTGVGLPPEHADQIFKAFFTTKDNGTGMGLHHRLRSIIESHGGNTWAKFRRRERCNFSVHPAHHARGARITFSAAPPWLTEFGVETRVKTCSEKHPNLLPIALADFGRVTGHPKLSRERS